MQIDFTPDPVQPPPSDPDPYLAADRAADSLPPDTTGWSLVPATAKDECGFTAAEYDEACRLFAEQGDPDLSQRAAARSLALREWMLAQMQWTN